MHPIIPGARNAGDEIDMKTIFALAIVFVLFGPVKAQQGDSPTAAYKRLYAAVKSRNTEAIKQELTRESIEFGVKFSQRSGKTIEQAYQNGFSATTFSAMLPEIRDERVKGNMGAVEVWNSKDKIWEDLPFIYEDGAWKFAVGEMFAGTYELPSKGRAEKEREAAKVSTKPGPKVVWLCDINAKVINVPVPKYPAAALAVRAQGKVDVQIRIDENGKVISAKATSGHPLLRSASESAALTAVFEPVTASNKPTQADGILTYNFLL
jgi:TonB family protein